MLLRKFLRTILTATVYAILILVLVGIPAVLFAAKIFGVGLGIPEAVEKTLRDRGINVTLSKLSVDWPGGLVAENVEVEVLDSDFPMSAKFDRLVVGLSFQALLRRQIKIERLKLEDAGGKIPVAGGKEAIRVESLSADIFLKENQLQIVRLEAEAEGIKFRGSGCLATGGKLRTAAKIPDRDTASRQQYPKSPLDDKFWTELLKEFRKLNFPKNGLKIEFELEGNVAEWDKVSLDPVLISCGPIEAERWRLGGAEGNVRIFGGRLFIDRLNLIGSNGGYFHLWAASSGSDFEFQAEGFLEFKTLKELFPPIQERGGDIQSESSPSFGLRGRFDFMNPLGTFEAIGFIEWEDLKFREVAVKSLAARFAVRRGKFFAPGFKIQTTQGGIEGDILLSDGETRLRCEASFNPTLIKTFVPRDVRRTLDAAIFRDPVRLKLELSGDLGRPRSLQGYAHVALGRSAMNGAWMDRVEADLRFADGTIHFDNLSIERKGDRGWGSVAIDLIERSVLLRDIRSDLNPVDVFLWIDPKIAETLKPYRFVANPSVKADGLVDLNGGSKSSLRVSFDSQAGFDYDLLGRTLRFGKTTGSLSIQGQTLRIQIPCARVMDGEASFQASLPLNMPSGAMQARVDVRRLNFPKVTKLYFDYDASQGVSSGNFDFQLPLGRESQITGIGSLRVEDGDVFAIPFLGPLSEVLSKIVKGAGHDPARLATADFEVGRGIISTKNLLIEGSGFSLYGHGDIYFLQDRINMTVRINARGVPGLFFFPVSKLFEYVADGRASKPEWRPKFIPRIR